LCKGELEEMGETEWDFSSSWALTSLVLVWVDLYLPVAFVRGNDVIPAEALQVGRGTFADVPGFAPIAGVLVDSQFAAKQDNG
jgi:hypothetical protein